MYIYIYIYIFIYIYIYIYNWRVGPGSNNRIGGGIYRERIMGESMIHRIHRIDSFIDSYGSPGMYH